MPIELKVPSIGESIREVVIGQWLKQPGQAIAKDESVVELESDKATVELPAPQAGTLVKILKEKGQKAAVDEVIALLEASAVPQPEPPRPSKPVVRTDGGPRVMPAAARALEERGISVADVAPTGPGGRVLKEDVLRVSTPTSRTSAAVLVGDRQEELVPMSPLRLRVAQRLVQAHQTAALLTTFNEMDMSVVIALRQRFKESFQERYGVKLGFMSFFVKACVDALKQFPALNAEIRGDSIAYRNYYDIGIAVAGGKGLVVPVLRNAERLSFAEIEQQVADFAARAHDNKLTLEELSGGTFTITNGGVFGSMLSTPIVNPPQSGILGMHAIEDRPVAREGQVVIRPMMYVALTYDHRIVDGREAVQFLFRIKEVIERPERMILEI